MHTNQLAQMSLEPIPIDSRLLEPWHDEAHPWMMEKGSECPNLEMRRSDSLPFACHLQEIGSMREPMAPRKAKLLRRRRTCSAT